jgi:putative ABC transport system permease protein
MCPERWLYVLHLRLRSLFRRRRVESELDEELRFHIERQIDDYVAKGLARGEARCAALRAFGAVEQRKEECRDMRHMWLMDEFTQDTRYAVRVFAQSPGFAAAAVLILALGIGVTSAMFSVVQAVLLRELPYPDAGRLVRMREQGNNGFMWVSWPDYQDWRARSRTFESMGLVKKEGFNVVGLDEPLRVDGQRATSEVFRLSGALLAAGRPFDSQADESGAPLQAVLSRSFARAHFTDVASAVGRMVEVDGEPCTVAGVLDTGNRLFMDADIVVSFGWVARLPSVQNRSNHSGTVVIGKLRAGVSMRAAETEMQTIARDLERAYPGSNAGVSVEFTSLYESLVGDVRPMVLTLAAAVGLVLLIACANVAGLLLARVPARRRELALRAALGAGRFRIARQLITESIVLAMAGGGLGLFLAGWIVRLVRRFAPPGIPRLETLQTNWSVLAVTFVVALATGLLFGLAPAWSGTRSEISGNLQEGGRTLSPGGGRLRGVLTTAEVAFSMLLLVGVGLLVRSFTGLLGVHPGFNPKSVLAIQLSLPAARYNESALRTFYPQILERLGHLPDVKSVGFVYSLPVLGSRWTSGYLVRDQPPPPLASRPSSSFNQANADYFRTMQIPLLDGRSFTDQDRRDTPPVAIVTRAFAKRHWPDGGAVGKQVNQGGGGTWRTVVGVVGDMKQNGLNEDYGAEVFFPLDQAPPQKGALVIRTYGSPTALTAAVRHEIRALDPMLPIISLETMEDLMGETLVRRRATMSLVSMFASFALVLAAIGIYGVIAYSVAQRTREIGIRMALGAHRDAIIRQVLWQGLKTGLAGVGIGLLFAPPLTSLMSTQLFAVGSLDPITLVAGATVLVSASLLASWLPARRASSIDPVLCMRAE